MPLMLFWLTPVFLLVVVILLIIQEQQKEKPKVFLVDPIVVLESLQIARIIGDEKTVIQELAMIRRVLPTSSGHIERVIRLLNPIIGSQNSKAVLLQHQDRSEFMQEYRYEHSGRVTSVIFGRLDDVVEASQDYSLLESLKQQNLRADQEGFASFAIARRVDARLIEGRQTYKMLGLVIAEPEISDQRVSKIRSVTSGKKTILLSWLPLGVTSMIGEHLFPTIKQISASATVTKQLAPKDRQNILDRVTLYAATTLNDRFEAVQHWRHSDRLITLGAFEKDQDHLPCEHVAL